MKALVASNYYAKEDPNPNLTREFYESISRRALKNCCPEFIELARECAWAIATECITFDGSMLTLLMQKVEPTIIPNPGLFIVGNDKANRALQRNYWTSANIFLSDVAWRGEKIEPARHGTHDMVHLYTSRIYGQTEIPPSTRAHGTLRLWLQGAIER